MYVQVGVDVREGQLHCLGHLLCVHGRLAEGDHVLLHHLSLHHLYYAQGTLQFFELLFQVFVLCVDLSQ